MTTAMVYDDSASDVRAAHEDLESILEAIQEEYGLAKALGSAAAVVSAIDCGTFDGRHYRAREAYTNSYGDHYEAYGSCVIGTMATYLGTNEPGHCVVPGCSEYGPSPIETFVLEEYTGKTAYTSRVLATVAHWLTSWMLQH